MGSLLAKLKTFLAHVLNVGETEVHTIATAALPIVEHLEQSLFETIRTAVAESKADILEAVSELIAAAKAAEGGSTTPAE